MQPIQTKRDLPAGNFLSSGSNRRWSARQKIHTPAYVSVDACEDGTIYGLNEVFDIGTGGLSFQSSEPLSPGSRVRLNLELAGTSEPVRATGRVVWAEPSGRTGVQLKRSSLSAPGRLDEYLFLNAITACSHYEALQSGTATSESPDQALDPAGLAGDLIGEPASPEFPDYPALLSCLTEIEKLLDESKFSSNSPLQTLAEQALTFLCASGVAIAVLSEGEIICCACAGSAPGLGTRFQLGASFSGECLLSGVLMHCDDAETDPRVDRAACVALGVRSILAAPIRQGAGVVGLIEVFATQPHAFGRNSRIFLQRLTEMVAAHAAAPRISTGTAAAPADRSDANSPLSSPMSPAEVHPDDSSPVMFAAAPEASDEFFSSRLQRILILGAAATLLGVVTLLMPWMRTKAENIQPAGYSLQPGPLRQSAFEPRAQAAPVSELKRLRQMAKEGDAHAQFALGAHYATGDEVAQDYSTAARWFSLAASQGHVVAQATLGAYYWAGRGVPENLHNAYFWSVLAQAGGDEGSKFRLASLASSMSHGEVVRVREEADEWIKRHQLARSTVPGRAP